MMGARNAGSISTRVTASRFAVAQLGPPAVRLEVAHPVRLRPEHGDEVALAFVVGDDDGERDDLAAAAAADLERAGPRRPEAGGERQGGQPVLPVWRTGSGARPCTASAGSRRSSACSDRASAAAGPARADVPYAVTPSSGEQRALDLAARRRSRRSRCSPARGGRAR